MSDSIIQIKDVNKWYEWKKQFLAEKIISTKMIGITEIEPAPGRYVKKKNK
jgi:hypothetical protein